MPGYALNTIFASCELQMEEEDKCKSDVTGVGLLRSIMWDAAEIPTFGPASLNDFRPYVLRNTQQAIIDIGGVELFHGVASWEVSPCDLLLLDEFLLYPKGALCTVRALCEK